MIERNQFHDERYRLRADLAINRYFALRAQRDDLLVLIDIFEDRLEVKEAEFDKLHTMKGSTGIYAEAEQDAAQSMPLRPGWTRFMIVTPTGYTLIYANPQLN